MVSAGLKSDGLARINWDAVFGFAHVGDIIFDCGLVEHGLLRAFHFGAEEGVFRWAIIGGREVTCRHAGHAAAGPRMADGDSAAGGCCKGLRGTQKGEEDEFVFHVVRLGPGGEGVQFYLPPAEGGDMLGT